MLSASDIAVSFLLHPVEHVRLYDGDAIPESLEVGFDRLGGLNREWIWVAKKGMETVGVLLASPCHGTAVIWRLATTDNASDVCVLRLLRQFLRDIRDRGCVGYITLVQPPQAHLQRIIEKTGGRITGEYTMLASPIPREGL